MLSNGWLHMSVEVCWHFYFHFYISRGVIRPARAIETLWRDIHNLTLSQVLNLASIHRLGEWLLQICAFLLHFNDIRIVWSIHFTIVPPHSCFRRHLELASHLSVYHRINLRNLAQAYAIWLNLSWLRLLIWLWDRIARRVMTIS